MEFAHLPQKSEKVRNALCPLELKGKSSGTSMLHMAVTFTNEAPFGGMERDCFLPPGPVAISLNALLLQLLMALLILSQKLSQ